MKLGDASILVVDDEPILLTVLAKWLIAIGGPRVFTAENGEAALAVMQLESIDLLLTDIRMPIMDGITLVRRLAEIGSTSPSIVFVSGFGDINRREMYALGVEAFITKPFERDELVTVLERAVAERSTLWHTAMAAEPRQSLYIQAKRFDEMASSDTVGLGRGGFSVCTSESISPGRVAFRILLTDPAIQITGQGYVRWCSQTDCKAGIELAFLEPDCRASVAEAIVSASPRSFVPGT